MPSPADEKFEIPGGILAVTTYGAITAETVQSLMDMIRHNMSTGVTNVHYTIVPGALVDKARNEAVKMLLSNTTLRYLLFIDGDMGFAPDVMQKLLHTAYHPEMCLWADAVGAWCPLRGKPYVPTIDTGTGTWESTDANIGPIEVMRTGSACLLIKRHVYERLAYPWYGVRPARRPIDFLAEVDNYARCKMDGRNLLREHAAWAALEKCAREDATAQYSNPQTQGPGGTGSSVGEDSAFCDKMKAAGFRIVVNTDVVCGHLDRHMILPSDHMAAMKENERLTRLAAGLLS